MSMIKEKITRTIFYILNLSVLFAIMACQSTSTPANITVKTDPVATALPIDTSVTQQPQEISPLALPVSPVEDIHSAVSQPVAVPTPSQGLGVVHGSITNIAGLPLVGLPVFLGKFDGTLIEISLNHSPKTVTDDNGDFVFADILPNDQSFQYALGIIIGDDTGSIIGDPNGEDDLIFNVSAGEIVELGVLESDLQ